MVERNYFRTMSEREVSQCNFDFCRDCPFYECELVEEYAEFRKNHTRIQPSHMQLNVANTNSSDANILSYDQSELKDGCFMSCRYVHQVACGREKVTEGIGDHFKIEIDDDGSIKENIKERWEPVQPVFISAQTGQGKNWFVENILIPYVKELNYQNKTDYKVLIISNRKALTCQIKNRISGKTELEEGLENEDEIIYSYADIADVITYQGVLKRKKHFYRVQNQMKSRYLYIICDEAHFFTSDAMFNPHTKEILCSIIETFANAVRMYMSATPYECLPYILKYEEECLDKKNYRKHYYNQNKWKNGQMVFYHFQRDYSYLEINSYTDISELYDKIFRSIRKNEKWLIFIDDKKKCNLVKKKLEEYIDKDSEKSWIAVIDAGGKDDKIYQSIV